MGSFLNRSRAQQSPAAYLTTLGGRESPDAAVSPFLSEGRVKHLKLGAFGFSADADAVFSSWSSAEICSLIIFY